MGILYGLLLYLLKNMELLEAQHNCAEVLWIAIRAALATQTISLRMFKGLRGGSFEGDRGGFRTRLNLKYNVPKSLFYIYESWLPNSPHHCPHCYLVPEHSLHLRVVLHRQTVLALCTTCRILLVGDAKEVNSLVLRVWPQYVSIVQLRFGDP
jgi:hypothetical protein